MTDRDEAPETAHVEDEYEEMQACPLPLMEVLDVLHGDKTVMYGTLRVAAVSTRRGEITPAFHHATPAGMSVLMPNGDTETVSMPGVQSAANDEQDAASGRQTRLSEYRSSSLITTQNRAEGGLQQNYSRETGLRCPSGSITRRCLLASTAASHEALPNPAEN